MFFRPRTIIRMQDLPLTYYRQDCIVREGERYYCGFQFSFIGDNPFDAHDPIFFKDEHVHPRPQQTPFLQSGKIKFPFFVYERGIYRLCVAQRHRFLYGSTLFNNRVIDPLEKGIALSLEHHLRLVPP